MKGAFELCTRLLDQGSTALRRHALSGSKRPGKIELCRARPGRIPVGLSSSSEIERSDNCGCLSGVAQPSPARAACRMLTSMGRDTKSACSVEGETRWPHSENCSGGRGSAPVRAPMDTTRSENSRNTRLAVLGLGVVVSI